MQEMSEIQVPSLGLEDTLEEGMATHSSILAWRILWTEESGRLQSIGSKRMGHNWSNQALTSDYYLVLFTCGGPGSIPSQETKIPCKPCSTAEKRKKNNRKFENENLITLNIII